MKGQYICNDCNYKWISRKAEGEPAVCPRCHYGDIEIQREVIHEVIDKIICGNCGRVMETKDVLGKCQGCEEIICKRCGKECKGCNKIFCKDCMSEEDPRLCGDCYKERCQFCSKNATNICSYCNNDICNEHSHKMVKVGFWGDREVILCDDCYKKRKK